MSPPRLLHIVTLTPISIRNLGRLILLLWTKTSGRGRTREILKPESCQHAILVVHVHAAVAENGRSSPHEKRLNASTLVIEMTRKCRNVRGI